LENLEAVVSFSYIFIVAVLKSWAYNLLVTILLDSRHSCAWIHLLVSAIGRYTNSKPLQLNLTKEWTEERMFWLGLYDRTACVEISNVSDINSTWQLLYYLRCLTLNFYIRHKFNLTIVILLEMPDIELLYCPK